MADTTVTGSNYADFCSYRLPCGLCTITNKLCAMENVMGLPDWNAPEITCVSSGQQDNTLEAWNRRADNG